MVVRGVLNVFRGLLVTLIAFDLIRNDPDSEGVGGEKLGSEVRAPEAKSGYRAPTEPPLLGFSAIYHRWRGRSLEGKGKQLCGEKVRWQPAITSGLQLYISQMRETCKQKKNKARLIASTVRTQKVLPPRHQAVLLILGWLRPQSPISQQRGLPTLKSGRMKAYVDFFVVDNLSRPDNSKPIIFAEHTNKLKQCAALMTARSKKQLDDVGRHDNALDAITDVP
uniref:Uncharacterized protein n=1 Tax=Globodera rostochiensis TaxID=31243 RepID=A0A914HNX4_GLORO